MTLEEYIPTGPIHRFTVSRPPPFRLSFHLCFRVVPGCVSSFPVGFSGPRGLRSGLVSEALRVVLRGSAGLSSYPSLHILWSLHKDNTMPSISSSPQEEVGQSHLSRPMVNPVFTVTSVKRTPWRTPCVRALCESCRVLVLTFTLF